MRNGEINFFDIDFERQSYYEVELRENGDCDSHFFRYKMDAIRYFNKKAKHPSDCVKFHRAYCIGGECEIIKEKEQWQ